MIIPTNNDEHPNSLKTIQLRAVQGGSQQSPALGGDAGASEARVKRGRDVD